MQTANTELCAAKEQALVALREKEEALKEKLVEALSSSHD